MRRVMELALENAGLDAASIAYVNAQGTATEAGDIAECKATHEVFGAGVPVSSLKSFFGHTLGACGAIEAWLTIEMMRASWIAPTRNLETGNPRCAPLDYVRSPRAGRAGAVRNEQQLRVRRHQHVADLPPLGRGMARYCVASMAPDEAGSGSIVTSRSVSVMTS